MMHNFEDTKTIKLLINLYKIQKLYGIVKSNNCYFLYLEKMLYRRFPLQKSTLGPMYKLNTK